MTMDSSSKLLKQQELDFLFIYFPHKCTEQEQMPKSSDKMLLCTFDIIRHCHFDMSSQVLKIYVHPGRQTQLNHGIFWKKATDMSATNNKWAVRAYAMLRFIVQFTGSKKAAIFIYFVNISFKTISYFAINGILVGQLGKSYN